MVLRYGSGFSLCPGDLLLMGGGVVLLALAVFAI